MKNILLFSLLMIAASSAFAQEDHTRIYKPFKVGLGLGYAVPGKGAGAGAGALLYIEPAYRASDYVSIGLRLESALIVRGVQGVSNSDVSGDATSNMSYTLNGQYYFNNNHVRPFVGAGLGLFSLAAVKFNTASGSTTPAANEVGAETSFGFYPRIGIDAGHFNLTIDYNFIPPTLVPGGGEVRNNYLGIRAGLSIGGGKNSN